MKNFHGYCWPDGADANVMRYIQHAADMRAALKHAPGRVAAVQAGGHCGIWPLWLAQRFERVFTFEPDPANWECLQANCRAQLAADRIFATNACLGAEPTRIRMATNGKNTGGHKGTREPGATPVVTIDGLQLAACDLIVLDVEGMELPALRGAERTLAEFRPVLMLEDRGHGDRHGWGGRDELFAWLHERGYVERARVSYDVVLTHGSAA
jgi:FkbM family methyltransferase